MNLTSKQYYYYKDKQFYNINDIKLFRDEHKVNS